MFFSQKSLINIDRKFLIDVNIFQNFLVDIAIFQILLSLFSKMKIYQLSISIFHQKIRKNTKKMLKTGKNVWICTLSVNFPNQY